MGLGESIQEDDVVVFHPNLWRHPAHMQPGPVHQESTRVQRQNISWEYSGCLPSHRAHGKGGLPEKDWRLSRFIVSPPIRASSDVVWELPQRKTMSAEVSIYLVEATYPHLSPRRQPIRSCFFSFRRKWAFPVNCLNQTSSNAAWDFLS